MATSSLPEPRRARNAPSFPLRHRAYRALWMVSWFLLASWTPRQLQPWRRALLRLFGARIERHSDVRPSARVWYPPNLVMGDRTTLGPRVNCYNMGLVTIGAGTVVSQRAHLCSGTHDHESPEFLLTTKPIAIGDHVWIGTEAFVGPGAVLADGVVLGARAVAFGALEPWTVYAGNPAKAVRKRNVPAGAAQPQPADQGRAVL
jgi:putative colanic acid biosynthesis acetyltransferase WcaF